MGKTSQFSEFIAGVKSGIPVFVGYFTASIAFGLLAVSSGLSSWEAILFSAVNYTGAGQFMSINLMAMGVSSAEAILSVLFVNFRYFLMSASLSIKIDFRHKWDHFLVAIGVTDENFTVASSKSGKVLPAFMYGIELFAWSGWVMGTAVGALFGSVLPRSLQEAAGVALFALFAALLVPEIKKGYKPLAIAVMAGLMNSCLVLFMAWPVGWSFVIAMLVATAIGTLFIREKEMEVFV